MTSFSIITASFNQGRFIQRSIDSILIQKNITVEHIILDNCSTDETSECLQKYQAQPGGVDVKVIVEPDDGQTQAINKGFKLARGDVVCWLNTDEYYYPGVLENVSDYFLKHPEVDVVFGDCDFVGSTGQLVKRKKEFGFSRNMLLYYGCFLPSCSTFIRRRIIDDGFFLNESYRVCMDFEWYTRLAFNDYQFAHFPQVFASFSWHNTNISLIQKVKRLEERYTIQNNYSNLMGPTWLKRLLFRSAQYFWILRRNLWRIRRGLQN